MKTYYVVMYNHPGSINKEPFSEPFSMLYSTYMRALLKQRSLSKKHIGSKFTIHAIVIDPEVADEM